VFASIELSPEESEMFNNHPKIGSTLLENIPRMEKVASIIGNQLKPYSQFSADEGDPEQNLSAQILKAVFDYDLLLFQGIEHHEALRRLTKRQDDYNPLVLEQIKHIKTSDKAREISSMRIQDLTVGMVIEENIMAKNGMLLAPKGQEITWPVLQGLLNFSRQVGVIEPVRVSVIV
jgi:response regulator RpfG family c-di-GMP phosphodiesterase